ncbi:GNAT family N-acetyltransferase [Phenylobacterium sp. J367]|uniref:GNAT family N-acetyltransferase n=1 Tax=Phenylobacterium sp. J367 TaxID=2898435 RepID=UPI002150F577|nr:N-acetyltransferase [Phenylobacterium sp. J367]MCR5877060.1 N-acetyltransferase [Phenylobacterium sp. J367]
MIRYAKPADHAAITEVVAAAFGQPDEARLVDRLRADGDVLFELVAEEAERIVGHILFSRLWADRYELIAALAPVAVEPGRQNDGLGSALVRAGLESAREFGAHGVIVLGHPAYYPRFGFSAETARTVKAPYAGSPAFMALALEPGVFDAPMTVAYPDAFGG